MISLKVTPGDLPTRGRFGSREIAIEIRLKHEVAELVFLRCIPKRRFNDVP
jgi:hypothetical protein